ncbi:MAG TPA: acetate--CoA ligase [Candidatus Dormibacteraeota bacterium]|nr:acetate--CoA ligase [Candidatus Dormibacteraeota bacterium]
MTWAPIRKRPETWAVPPNMANYEATCAAFSWDAARRELLGAPRPAGFNIADLAVDRHAEGALSARVAVRWLGRDGRTVDLSFRDLRDLTNRFANALRALGVARADRVFALTGRIPALYVAALGTLKRAGVFCPLFSAFGPEPLAQRLGRGDAKVLVTTERLYRKSVAALRSRLPQLRHVLIADVDEDLDEGVWSLPKLMAGAKPEFTVPRTDPEEMALLHFTSGTTGMPKGAIHVHEAAVTHYVTGRYALDLHPGDVYWCTADPGWVTGTSYGIIAPLLHGVTSIVDEGDFDAERWYGILQRERVSVWYTAPTAIRMLMRLPVEPRTQYDLTSLRFVASVGEPLNPTAVVWGQDALGLPIHDNWWQTETGGIMIANYRSMEIRPGSMGRPLPGVGAAIVRRSLGGDAVEAVLGPGEEGEMALKPGWPSMFRGYLHEQERYEKCFVGGWYMTGDLATRDADGYFTFVGRADDIIKTAGHMVGPFEVESALMEHPAVAEAGVIGKPDPVIGEIVKAFVVLKPGFEASEDLRLELIGYGRKKLGSVVAPKEIAFERQIPRTRSGKIMRRLLKVRELGLPEGDTSTLETPV